MAQFNFPANSLHVIAEAGPTCIIILMRSLLAITSYQFMLPRLRLRGGNVNDNGDHDNEDNW